MALSFLENSISLNRSRNCLRFRTARRVVSSLLFSRRRNSRRIVGVLMPLNCRPRKLTSILEMNCNGTSEETVAVLFSSQTSIPSPARSLPPPAAAVDCRNSRRVSGAGLMQVMVVQPCAAGHCIEFQPVQESRVSDCRGGLQTIDSHRTCGGARSATAAGLRIRNPRARSLWWRLIVARIEVRERQHNIRAKEKPADLAGFSGY